MSGGSLVIDDGREVRRVPLGVGRQTLGRTQDNDVVVAQSFVSRQHANIVWRNGVPVLVDAGSTNGLRVGGQRVSECELRPGTVVEIVGPEAARVRLRFEPEAPVGSAATFVEPRS